MKQGKDEINKKTILAQKDRRKERQDGHTKVGHDR